MKNISPEGKQEKPPTQDTAMERPDKTMYFLDIALSVAKRSTCLRRKFGAVIVKDNTIVGTGYNGNARGVVNCSEIGCIKNIMQSPQGKAYDYCPAVHAEENAIINSNRADRISATLYLAGITPDEKYTMALPCQRCQRKIINSQIKQVILLKDDGKPMTINVQEYVKGDSDWYTQLIEEAKKHTKNL
jgi:dCMP deaminase